MVNKKHGILAAVFALLALVFVGCATTSDKKDMEMMKDEKTMQNDKMMKDEKTMKDDKMMQEKKS